MVLYGLIQIADVELGTSWDWIGFINPGASFGPTSTVWSTFGNPNHLAGFVACLLPIGLIVVISDRSVLTRVLAGAVLAGALLCLVETSSLGGLGAAVGALILTGLLLIPELRQHKRMAAWLGAGVAVAAVVGVVIVAAQGTLGDKLEAATDWSSGTSTAAQRVEYWKSATDMASDRPLLGWGPDTFGYLSPTYQTQKFVDAFGPDQTINGAHNTFLQTLANEGRARPRRVVVLRCLACPSGVGRVATCARPRACRGRVARPTPVVDRGGRRRDRGAAAELVQRRAARDQRRVVGDGRGCQCHRSGRRCNCRLEPPGDPPRRRARPRW